MNGYKRRYQTAIKRFVSVALCVAMLFSQNTEGFITARAEDVGHVIQVYANNGVNYNGQDAELFSSGMETGAVFDYGLPLNLSLTYDGEEKAMDFYLADVVNNNVSDDYYPFSSSEIYEPGLYMVGFEALESSGITLLDVDFRYYSFEIAKTPLAVPGNLLITNGCIAQWNRVSADRNGNALSAGNPDYTITIYKDGEVLTTDTVSGTGEMIQSYNLLEKMLASGAGIYTFSVAATASSTLSNHYTNSLSSAVSATSAKAVKVSLEGATGIESVSFDGSTDEETLLIAGSAGYASADITTTTVDGWNFSKYISGETGIDFATETQKTTTITISSDYSGNVNVTITAVAKEENGPVISDMQPATGDNVGKITATVTDEQSGLVAYAFSAETPADDAWTVLPGKTTEQKTFLFTPTTGGEYRFYAKDADGNISYSENTVKVSKITYNNLFKDNSIELKSELYIGDGEYTLHVHESGARKGYVFGGWYESAACDGAQVISLTVNPAANKTYYAKWTLTELAWNSTLISTGYTYSGEDIVLQASVNSTTADVVYKWYKEVDGEFVLVKDNDTVGKYKIRNVVDSGIYRVDAESTYVDDAGVTQKQNIEGIPAEITVAKAPLNVTVDNKTVAFGSEAPEYTFRYSGLLGDDISDISGAKITEGSLECAYAKGDSKGVYDIVFASSFSSENYDITPIAGKLTVTAKSNDVSNNDLRVELNVESYEYTGGYIYPDITVYDGDTVIPSSDYTVTYDNNIFAGIHTLYVHLKNNYDGILEKKFTITKKGVEIVSLSIDGWIYGDPANAPSINEGMPSDLTDYDIEYRYLPGKVAIVTKFSGGTTTVPSDAGEYTLYAIITDNNGNYEDIVAQPEYFTIDKKKIYLIAESWTGDYDGNAHTFDSYRIEDKDHNVIALEDVFVLPKESFHSITVSGSITDVKVENGENVGVKNTISYVLSSATNADNYDIECINGTLKLVSSALLSPANIQWDNENPGAVTWVAIVKTNLSVTYKIALYSHDAANPGEDSMIGEFVTTTETEYDFKDIIHSQIEAGTRKSFYVKISTVPTGGSALNNYKESPLSDDSPSLYTATIYLSKYLCEEETGEQPGIADIHFVDESITDGIVLIQGESVEVTATRAPGYVFESSGEDHHADSHFWSNRWHTVNYDYRNFFSSLPLGSASLNTSTARITVNGNLTESLPRVDFTVHTEDEAPSITNISAKNADDYSGVIMSADLHDSIELKWWGIQKVVPYTFTDPETGEEYTEYTPDGDYYRTNFEAGTKNANVSWKITDDGIYRFMYSDRAGHYWYSIKTFYVYKVSFDSGEANDTENVMPDMFKLADTNITLPTCIYERTGYTFKNWTGENTGISVDGATYKANKSDILVAHWSSIQYSYTVEYYYMNTDGTYSATPDDTADFIGNYSDSVSISDAAIQKSKPKYVRDDAPVGVADYSSSMILLEDNQVIRIYYKIGNHKITYKYTLPGAADETVIELSYFYGQEINEEAEKPSVIGYNFVGWIYEGSGTKPDVMPDQNIIATGNFVPLNTTYNIVYHMETLGAGEVKTGVFEIASARTITLNSKQDEVITAYLEKGDELGNNEIEGGNIDGFTLKGVIVSEGAASNSEEESDTLPADLVEGGSTTGTVQYDSDKTLYVNYYYERNVYDFVLEVWKDSRESETNKRYTETVKRQFEENVEDLTALYKLDSYYIDAEGNSVLDGFTMPTGYKFASYTDYSTGNAPVKMPAGKVTAIRDIIAAEKTNYDVVMYFEKDAIDSYTEVARLNYDATADTKIKIVENFTEDDGEYKYINYKGSNGIAGIVNNSSFYKFKSVDYGDDAEYATVKADGTTEIKVYFERKTTIAAIRYYYGNTYKKGDNQFAVFYVSGKWGSTYEIDPAALFDAASVTWYEDNSSYRKDTLYNASSVSVGTIVDKDGVTQDGRTYDFRNNNYLVSYQGFYYYFDEDEVRTGEYPAYTLTEVDKSDTTNLVIFGKNTKLNNRVVCTFGCSSTEYAEAAHCYIYYNEISEKEDFYLDVRLNQDSFTDKNLAGWDYETSLGFNGYKDSDSYTFTYPDAKNYIPIVYGYDEDGNGKVDADEYFQVRIINKCAVINGTKVPAGDGLEDYPAANSKSRKYTYSDGDSIREGFTRIGTTNYYFYDGSGSGIDGETAYSNKKAVYYLDSRDRFLQGAYEYYGLGTGTFERTQAEAIVSAYKAAHVEDKAELYALDDNASAIYCTNASYGSTHVSGNFSYLTFTYGYHDKVNLYYYYDGVTCSAHQYSYGKTVTAEEIGCNHIFSAPAGYKIIWYKDSTRQHKADSDITLTSNITLYGNLEKSTIKNLEYIHYELADPVVVGPNTYNYIDSEDFDAIREVLGDKLVETEIDEFTTLYTIGGAYAYKIIVRPTLSFTELYLSKDDEANADKSYEAVYGQTGFFYDETNTNNRSYGYVNTSPIKLHVYFARDKYQVEVRPMNSDIANSEYKSFSIDQHVNISAPSKEGYSFAGWKWYKAEDGSLYVPTVEDGETYFKMPAFDLIAEAQWAPANFSQDIIHYFQTSKKSYDSSYLDKLNEGTLDETYDHVSFIGKSGSAFVYKDGDRITGVKYVVSANEIYYFSTAAISGTTLTLDEMNLVAAKTTVSVCSEAEVETTTEVLSGFDLFVYSYTGYKVDSHVARYEEGDTFVATVGMTLEYFYSREADLKVRLFGVATDGGATGLALTGGGEAAYGDTVTLMAAISSGYQFMGWFMPSQIFSDYTYNPAIDLSTYVTKDGFGTDIEEGTIVPVSTSPDAYTIDVSGNVDRIAVVKPMQADEPGLSVTGKKTYTYGYEQSGDNMLLAIASFAGLGDAAHQTSVTGYKWYKTAAHVVTDVGPGGEIVKRVEADEADPLWEEIGETSSAFPFPVGQNAGGYLYKVEVTYRRLDNGRTGTSSCEAGVIVNKANMTVDITNYSGVFDNTQHKIGVTVTKPVSGYTAYYHANTPLTSENYEDGQTTIPGYIHVNSNELGPCAHTTYIYIKGNDNYNDYVGSGTVNITPKNISIQALSSVFSKMYDGNEKVTGLPNDEDSDMYNLSHGRDVYYSLKGFYSDDHASANYILACDATYNSTHVDDARSFVIQDLYLVNAGSGETEYDYCFPAATTLTFSGHIVARPLNVEWDSASEYVYNGLPQGPNAGLKADQDYPIPEIDKPYISINVSGKQTNVGSYTATAMASVLPGGTFKSSDYTFDTLSKPYTITRRKITVTPVTTDVSYNGETHTISDYEIYKTGTTTLDEVVNDTTRFNTSAVQKKTYTNAGNYTDMQFKNLEVTNLSGVELTDNYDVTYALGTLNIHKAKVVVEGITADEKPFDGTKAANIHVGTNGSVISFVPLYSQNGIMDELTLDATKISGLYHTPAAGETIVDITILQDALSGRSKDNYEIDIENSQKTAAGLITKSDVYVKAEPVTVVYGETPSFNSSYSGIYKEDGTVGTYEEIASSVTGNVNYLIKVNGEWITYVPGTIGVGSYEIKADVTELEYNDYSFAWQQASDYSILTVTKRPVYIKSSDSPDVTKIYDGTTDVSANKITKTEDYIFVTVPGDSYSGVLDEDLSEFDIDRDTFTAVYDNKNVSGATKVTLNDIVPNNGNYMFVNESGTEIDGGVDISANISKKDLSVVLSEKEITYGDTAPEGFVTTGEDAAKYTITITGFVSGENESVIPAGIITLENEYDNTDSALRNVGRYDVTIKASGYETGNYRLVSDDNEITSAGIVIEDILNVTPATITITMPTRSMAYKIGDDTNQGFIPVFTGWTYSGYVYPEDTTETVFTPEELAALTPYVTVKDSSTEVTVSLSTIAGYYDIKLCGLPTGNVPTGVGNYKIEVNKGKLTVRKSKLYLDIESLNSVLTVLDKIYDGTTAVDPEKIIYTAENRAALIEELSRIDKDLDKTMMEIDKIYLTTGPGCDDPILVFDSDSGTYCDKNVGTDKEVILEYKLSGYLAERYELLPGTCKNATANILPAPLDITADNKIIKYGENRPAFTYTPAGLVAGETLEATTDFSGTLSYTCDYTNEQGNCSEVGNYAIVPSGVENSNYDISFNEGVLTVTQNKLATPIPSWDAANPGTVAWTAISRIGDVEVAGYIAELYKDGVLVSEATKGSIDAPVSSTSVDFADDIRAALGGRYTVKVMAVASKTNNAENKNVLDSEQGTTATTLYATDVTVEFAGDADGIGSAVTIDEIAGDPISINGHRHFVLIAGESAVDAVATMKNATGYIADVSASEEITLGTAAFDDADVTIGVSVDSSATPAANTTVTVTLAKRPATFKGLLKAEINTADGKVYYGFDEASAPRLSVVPSTVNDNIDADGYTYSAVWTYCNEKTLSNIITISGNELTNVFPNLNDNPVDQYDYIPSGKYRVYCTVVATRKDNGESTEVTSAFDVNNRKFVTIQVYKGSFSPQISFTAVGDTWEYGEARILPQVSQDQGVAVEKRHYVYSESADEASFPTIPDDGGSAEWWSSLSETPLTDVGTHYVRVYIEPSENFEAAATNIASYTVTKATLDTPDNLGMYPSATAPYGLFKWDEVVGPVENNGEADSQSSIVVAYEVEFFFTATGDTEAVRLAKITTAETNHDFTDYVTDAGKYTIKVTAIVSNPETEIVRAKGNCNDSDAAHIEAIINVGTKVVSNLPDPGKYEKVYDSEALTLSVNYSVEGLTDSDITYQWLRNGDPIVGATAKTYSIYYVEDSATYTCRIVYPVADGTAVTYSSVAKAKITPRPVTIYSGSTTREYNGLALTNGTISAKDETPLPGDDYISAGTTTGTITAVGEVDNPITGLKINRGSKVVYSYDVSSGNNYEVTYEYGKLKIEPRKIANTGKDDYTSGITVSAPAAFTYDGTEHKPTVTVSDGAVTLVEGIDYTLSWTNAIEATYEPDGVTRTVTDAEKYAYVVISGIGNYSETIRKEFVIKQREVTLLSEDKSKVYDASPLTSYGTTGATKTMGNSELVSGALLEITSATKLADGDTLTFTFTGTQTNVGSSDNTYSSIVVKSSDGSVRTSSYAFTTNYGTLTVSAATIDCSANDYDGTYDAEGHSITVTVTSPSTAKIYYSKTPLASVEDFETAIENGDATLTNPSYINAKEEGYTVYYYVKADNYNGVIGSAKVIIHKADQTVNASDVTAVYDGEAHSITDGTATGVTAGDTTVGAIAYSANNSLTDVYTVTVTVTAAETINYKSASKEVTLKVTPRPVTVSWDYSAPFTYDGSAKEVNAILGNIIAGDDVSAGDYSSDSEIIGGVAYSAKSQTNAGTYKTYIKTLTGSKAGNYTLVSDGADVADRALTWKINKASLVYSASGYENVYDKEPHTIEVNVTSPASGAVIYYSTTELNESNYSLASTDEIEYVNVGVYNVYFYIVAPNYEGVAGSRTVTITKATQTINISELVKDYDYNATERTITGAYAEGVDISSGEKDNNKANPSAVTTIDSTTVGQITYVSNARTNAGETTVTIKAAETRNYKPAQTTAVLKISPIALESIVPSSDTVEYTGSKAVPESETVMSVDPSLPTLSSSDYTITYYDVSGNEIENPVRVGTYTIKATGRGNYTGTVSCTYDIVDTDRPVVTGITNNGKYCEDQTFTVTDKTLQRVVVTKVDSSTHMAFDGAEEPFITEDFSADDPYTTTYSGTLPGTHNGTKYIVRAYDASDNMNLEMVVYVYDDHSFTTYVKNSTGTKGTADCNHECGATDTRVYQWGSVEWDYAYSYSVPDVSHNQEGVLSVGERATYARVELKRNGVVIATRIVNCEDICGPSAADPADNTLGHLIAFRFDAYNPSNPTADESDCNERLPEADSNGHHYSYQITVKAVSSETSTVDVNDFQVDYNYGYTNESDIGTKASISYKPGCFNVPWKVVLKNIPEEYAPDVIYVKVLYATTPDAVDSDYNVITQQSAATSYGVPCMKQVAADGSYYYTGSYPVWKYISGTTDSYYHRIQVVAYDNGDGIVNVAEGHYRSICDEDHVNHTIYYTGSGPSGTILYEIEAFDVDVPILVFDGNPGKDTKATVKLPVKRYVLENNGDPVTAAMIAAAKPSRKGYIFLGWYTARTGGTKVSSISSLTGTKILYAHWEKEIEADPGDDSGDDKTDKPDDETETSTSTSISDTPETEPDPPVEIDPVIPTVPEEILPEEKTDKDGDEEDNGNTGTSVQIVNPSGTAEPAEEETKICYWHYLILLADLIMILGILLTLKKKTDDEEDEEDEENENISDSEETEEEDEDELKERRRKSTIRRWIVTAIFVVVMLILNILGFCRKELPWSVISTVVVSILNYGGYKIKFRKDKDEEEDSQANN